MVVQKLSFPSLDARVTGKENKMNVVQERMSHKLAAWFKSQVQELPTEIDLSTLEGYMCKECPCGMWVRQERPYFFGLFVRVETVQQPADSYYLHYLAGDWEPLITENTNPVFPLNWSLEINETGVYACPFIAVNECNNQLQEGKRQIDDLPDIVVDGDDLKLNNWSSQAVSGCSDDYKPSMVLFVSEVREHIERVLHELCEQDHLTE